MNSNIHNYDDFFNFVWDEVSSAIVTEEIWEIHKDRFYEVTYSLYDFYRKTIIRLPDGTTNALLPTKVCARIIESFVVNFKDVINC